MTAAARIYFRTYPEAVPEILETLYRSTDHPRTQRVNPL